MALIGDQIEDYVQKQIMDRQKFHGSGVLSERTEEQLLYLNSKTSFIKLASGVSMTEKKLKEMGADSVAIEKYKGMGLAKEHVLFGGYARMDVNPVDKQGILVQRNSFLGNDGAYEASSDWGIVPMPGIDSIDVKSMNRGSLKKATVRLTAQNRDQLTILDVLYMRLGYTVLLEWGNTLYIDKDGKLQKMYTSLIENNKGFFNSAYERNKSYLDILPQIQNARKAHAGNFDAILGKVSNFNWSFNNDGSYDIELTIISLGDVVESLKTNVPAVSSTLAYVNSNSVGWLTENDSLDQHRKDNIILSLLHVFRLQNLSPTGKDITITTKDNPIAKPGKLLSSGGSKISYGSYELTLTAKYYFYNAATKKNVTTTQELKYDDSGNYVPKATYTTPTDGTITTHPKYLPSGQIYERYQSIDLADGGQSSLSKTLVFMSTDPTKTFSETKQFSEVQITEWEKDKTNPDSPITQWINDWKTKYTWKKEEFNTRKNGWAPSDLVPFAFKDLKTIEDIIYDNNGSKHQAYSFVSNITDTPVKSSTGNTTISNPLNGTGYEENDAFLLKMTPQQYYIRFGYLLKLLKSKVITRIDTGEKSRGKNPNLFNIDTENAPMLALPLQISYDWRTCIVSRSDFNRPGDGWKQNIFPELQPWVTNKNAANAMNVYLNFNFIADSMISNTDAKGNISVYDFIKAMCDGINKALAGVNNLEPIIDEEDNTLRIFDSTPRSKPTSTGSTSDPKYKLQLYGYGNGSVSPKDSSTFVRKVDLKTAITPEYATMVTVGAAAGGYVKGTEATAFARWNDGIIDRFKTKLLTADPDVEKAGKADINEDDAAITYFQSMNWTAKCFGLDVASGDTGARIWELFP